MSLAPQELENSASKFAAEAIKLDSQGARGMAIANYQRAIESLVKLIQLYPENKLNKVYQERTAAYQNRIKALQMNNVELEPAVDPKATPEEQKQSLTKNELDSLIMKEKPNVTWEEVIGLEDAKNALRESIVYPEKGLTCSHLDGQEEFCFMDLRDVARQSLQQLLQMRLMVTLST